MKLTDYVADFVASLGVKRVFVVTGGAVAHLIDSIGAHPSVEYVAPIHEQAAAMAADGYARVSRRVGVAMSTTGPGMTNMITGIAGMYYDSIPGLFISGQVASFRSSAKIAPGVRQLGFQEAPHLDMVRPITKYAALVDDPTRIRYELEKAVCHATHGRPGPVFLDIPDDVQRAEVDPESLESYVPDPPAGVDREALRVGARKIVELLRGAKRPVLVLGRGVRISSMEKEAVRLARRLGIPVALTWAVWDLLPASDRLHVGAFGVSGTRRGNFAIQNSDLVISLGSRLDTHATGSPVSTFARAAKKIVVDIDPAEIDKFRRQGLAVDVPIVADLKDFFAEFEPMLDGLPDLRPDGWLQTIRGWKERYPSCEAGPGEADGRIDPYRFVAALSGQVADDDIIVSDTGANLIQFFQAYDSRPGQAIFSALNNTPMGYALPASIGAAFAGGGRRVICLTGDGGLQVNIQELATLAKQGLPLKIFAFDNHGFGIIQQTQDDWLESRYHASTAKTGLPDPDFVRIGEAFGIPTLSLARGGDMEERIRQTLSGDGPAMCVLDIDPAQRIVPMLKYGRPIEDPHPLLERERFLKEMIVPPLDVSLRAE